MQWKIFTGLALVVYFICHYLNRTVTGVILWYSYKYDSIQMLLANYSSSTVVLTFVLFFNPLTPRVKPWVVHKVF